MARGFSRESHSVQLHPARFYSRRYGVYSSLVLHLLVFVVAVFGLPDFLRPPPELPEPIPVELANIGDVTTKAPSKQVEAPHPEEKPAESPKQETVPEPPRPMPKPEPELQVKPVPSKPAPPTPAEEPDQIPVPSPKPKPPEPTKEKPPSDVLQNVVPPVKKPPPQDSFDTLLKSIDKMRQSTPTPSATQAQQLTGSNKTVNSPISDSNSQPTASERDYVAAQIWPKWNVDLGAKGAETLVVNVKIVIMPDGKVTSARLDVDTSRYESDTFYRAAADAAVRAVFAASPLKVPATRPSLFKDNPNMTIKFDPRSMIR